MRDAAIVEVVQRHAIPVDLEKSARHELDLPETYPTGV
jgi:hypothetical protein